MARDRRLKVDELVKSLFYSTFVIPALVPFRVFAGMTACVTFYEFIKVKMKGAKRADIQRNKKAEGHKINLQPTA